MQDHSENTKRIAKNTLMLYGRMLFSMVVSLYTSRVILNALGTVDVVPLTGVTFPFVSNGGSSMICAWGLLAFIKAADTRQNASFAVKLTKNGGTDYE